MRHENYPSKQAGLIRTIIVIIIAIAILSYFGVDIKQGFASPQAQSNFSYVWGGVTYAWNNFLSTPAQYIWNNIIVGIVWNVFLSPLIHSLQHAQTTSGQ